jgi:sec-independent protein translocase protein TatB
VFDFSLGEMLVVALVALVVLGPERLPKAARFAGLWVRKARAQWYTMKNELEQELANDELRRSLQESRQSLQDTEAALRDLSGEAQQDVAAAAPPTALDGTPDGAPDGTSGGPP